MDREAKQKKPENISKLSVRQHGSFRRKAALIAALLLMLFLGICIAAWFNKIEEITVRGNIYTDPTETAQEFFSNDSDMRTLVIIFRTVTGKYRSSAFDKVTVKLTGLHSAVLEVTETEAVTEIEDRGLFYILNRSGILLRTADADTGLTRITGLTVDESRNLTLLKAEPEEELEKAQTIFEMMEERGMTPSLIEVSGADYTVSINDAHVVLGTLDHLAQKLDVLEQQSGYVENLSGTLHLENYDGTEENGTFWFTVGE